MSGIEKKLERRVSWNQTEWSRQWMKQIISITVGHRLIQKYGAAWNRNLCSRHVSCATALIYFCHSWFLLIYLLLFAFWQSFDWRNKHIIMRHNAVFAHDNSDLPLCRPSFDTDSNAWADDLLKKFVSSGASPGFFLRGVVFLLVIHVHLFWEEGGLPISLPFSLT